MKCETVSPLLEEYFDGELDLGARSEVAAHLEACSRCAAALMAIEGEQALYATYDRGFEPGEGMWAAVLDRIERGEAPAAAQESGLWQRLGESLAAFFTLPRLVPIAAACALVVAAALTMKVWNAPEPISNPAGEVAREGEAPHAGSPGGSDTKDLEAQPDRGGPALPATVASSGAGVRPRVAPRRPPTIPPTGEPREVDPEISSPVAAAERQYLEAIAVLNKDVDLGGDGDDSLRRDLAKPLNDIDDNIAAARQAVERDPNDPVAVLNMMAAYDEKIDVLQRMARYQVARDR